MNLLLLPECQAFGLSSSHAILSALGALYPFHTEILYWYFKGQLQCHLVCEHSLRLLYPWSPPHALSLQAHAFSPGAWLMDGSVCLSILSQLHLYFAYFKLLQSKGSVSYFPISFPPPQLAPCASKEQVSQARFVEWWLTLLIDWLIGLNETHLHICSPAVKMKYMELIQPLVWKQFLGNASCQVPLFMIMSEIKSRIQPFETSTLKFNLRWFFSICPYRSNFHLVLPCSVFCVWRLNTRKHHPGCSACSFQLMNSPRGGTERRRPGFISLPHLLEYTWCALLSSL